MTIHWIGVVYLLAGWGVLDIFLRILLRVPPWPDHNPFDLRRKETLRTDVSGQGQGAATRILELHDLLCSIWLYVKWDYVTKQLTTEQKELWADVIDGEQLREWDQEIDPSGITPVDRWWRK